MSTKLFVIFCYFQIIIHGNPCSVGDWIHKKTNFSSLSQVSGLRKKEKSFSGQTLLSDSLQIIDSQRNSWNIFGKEAEFSYWELHEDTDTAHLSLSIENESGTGGWLA